MEKHLKSAWNATITDKFRSTEFVYLDYLDNENNMKILRNEGIAVIWMSLHVIAANGYEWKE